MVGLIVAGVVAVFILLILASAIKILREYERGVIFRLGRLIAQKGPGLILLIPIIDQMVRIDLRTVTLNVPPQEVITKDNVTVRVNAVAYFRVVDPNKAITEVENYLLATSQIAQTTLRSVLGKAELDALLAERERLNIDLQQIIDEQTEPWGIKVSTVEVKDVELPVEMQRAIARQAEAERERRAKVIAADGEFQAAEKLSQAADIIGRHPATLQLRYLQTLLEMGSNQSSTIVFPLPMDLLKAFAPAPNSRPAPAPGVACVLTEPEIRIDELTGRRAILAPGRAERPDAFTAAPADSRPDAAESCPLCEGREDRTPPEVWANRDGGAPDTPGWTARSVPNLYPVLGAANEADPSPIAAAVPETGMASSIDPLGAATRGQPDLFRSQAAVGAHEVIISPSEHATSLAQLSERQLAVAVEAWRERMRAHRDAAYVHLIVNEGPLAGASLEHTHAQLYALAFVPAEIARERERASAYHDRTAGGHLLADVATEEVRRQIRLVAVDEEAVLICPWASRSPFELRVVPRTPAPRFEDDDRGAAMIATALHALGAALGAVPQLNLWVRTAPHGTEEFGWHVDILPRLATRAGFELGTGVDINVYAPEQAAAGLRGALAGRDSQ